MKKLFFIFTLLFLMWTTSSRAMAVNEDCVANAVNLIDQTTFKDIILNPRIGTFSVATNGETPTIKAQIDGLLEANKWVRGDNGELYNPSRSKLYNGICYLGVFNAVCTSNSTNKGVGLTQAYQAKIATQQIGKCSAIPLTPQVVNSPGILEKIIDKIKQVLLVKKPNPTPSQNTTESPAWALPDGCGCIPSASSCDGTMLALTQDKSWENTQDLGLHQCTFRDGNARSPGRKCCKTTNNQSSENTNTANVGTEIPVYPGAKLVPKIGRPVANGWNRLYVIGGVQVNEVLQYYQDWMGKAGRIARILLPLSTRDVTADNYDHCSSIDVALGSGGKVGQEMISIKISAVTPHNDCTFILDNAQPGITGGDQQAVGYSFTTHFTRGFSLTPNAYNVGGNNTVIDIYYTSKQERVNNGSPIPPSNNVVTQKPLPNFTQNPPAPDDWYKLIPKVGLGYFLENLGHAFRSLLPFGWGK